MRYKLHAQIIFVVLFSPRMYYFTHWEAQPNRRKKSRTKRKKLSQFFIFTLLCGASKGFMKAWISVFRRYRRRPAAWNALKKTHCKLLTSEKKLCPNQSLIHFPKFIGQECLYRVEFKDCLRIRDNTNVKKIIPDWNNIG